MPLYISVKNDCTTSAGPGKNTRGKTSMAVTSHHSATSGMNGTMVAMTGQRMVRRR